jgi:carbamoyl-phosphate synthase large subunit
VQQHSPIRKSTILLLSGGGHTGLNVLAALTGRRSTLRLVASSDAADEPALFGFDAAYLAPSLANDPIGFERRFIEIVSRERPDLVIPCRDEDTTWLSQFGQRRHDLGPRFLCGSPAIAAMAEDKWLSYEFARRHGLPFAPTLACDASGGGPGRIEEFVAAHGFPLVLKPRRGANGRGIRLITNIAQAVRAAAQRDSVLQKYLGLHDAAERHLDAVMRDGIPLFHSFEGIKHSLQILIGPTGDLIANYCSRHVITDRNARTLTPDFGAEGRSIAEHCAQVFAAQGWRGPMNIQCQPDASGRLMIHEFNARFTGATAARRLLGHDEVGIALAAFIGHPLDAAVNGEHAGEVREGLAPRAASPDNIRLLARQGAWDGGPR